MTEIERKKKRKQKYRLRRFYASVLIITGTWYFNNYTLKINNTSIHSSKISNPVRIAVISDTHSTSHGISNKSIIKKVVSSKPDIIMVLGDMYTSGSSQKLVNKAVSLTASLVQTGKTVYFVPGEHDSDPDYIAMLKRVGAEVMSYESEITEINGNKFQIIGIDNVYYSPTFDLKNAFTKDDECFSVLMAHIPYYEKFADFGTDLTLCADTHGFMAQLPFNLGAFYNPDTKEWFPEIKSADMVYDKGWFDYSGGKMFITSGIGVSPMPIRFNNRPEIAVIDILPE